MSHPTSFLAAAVIAGVLLLSGCASSTEPDPPAAGPDDGAAGGGSSASCVAGLTLDDTFYLQVEADRVTAGEALEGAEVPPCNDTGGAEGEAMPIDAFVIEGVDPTYAVVAEGGAGPMVYVAEGYAPGLRDAEPLPQDVAGALGLR